MSTSNETIGTELELSVNEIPQSRHIDLSLVKKQAGHPHANLVEQIPWESSKKSPETKREKEAVKS